jgi:hypothetical protein
VFFPCPRKIPVPKCFTDKVLADKESCSAWTHGNGGRVQKRIPKIMDVVASQVGPFQKD